MICTAPIELQTCYCETCRTMSANMELAGWTDAQKSQWVMRRWQDIEDGLE